MAPIICAGVAFAIVFIPLLIGLIHAQVKRLSRHKEDASGLESPVNPIQTPMQQDSQNIPGLSSS